MTRYLDEADLAPHVGHDLTVDLAEGLPYLACLDCADTLVSVPGTLVLESTFRPQPYQRSHCARCGAARRLHGRNDSSCPVAYRPGDLTTAYAALRKAQAANDQAAVFAARGDVQHLGGDPDCSDPLTHDQDGHECYPGQAANLAGRGYQLRQVRCPVDGGALITLAGERSCERCGRVVP